MDWHGRLKTLYKRAYNHLTPVQVENSQDLREQFLMYLRHQKVGMDVWRNRPATYTAAHDQVSDRIAAARLWEANHGGGRLDEASLNSLDPDFDPISDEPAVQSFGQPSYGAGRGRGSSQRGHPSRGRGAAAGPRGLCFECGIPGHFARDCYYRPRSGGVGNTGRYHGQGGSQE